MVVVVALVASLAALGISLFLALAMVELVNQHSEAAPRIEKEIIDLDLSDSVVGHRLSELGLEEFDTPTGMILLLSPTCTACLHIANGFDGVIPPFVRVVVTAGEPSRLRRWALDRRLPRDEMLFDDDRMIADALSISSSPSIIGISDNAVAFGAGVSNSEAFREVYDQMLEASSEFDSRAKHLNDPLEKGRR